MYFSYLVLFSKYRAGFLFYLNGFYFMIFVWFLMKTLENHPHCNDQFLGISAQRHVNIGCICINIFPHGTRLIFATVVNNTRLFIKILLLLKCFFFSYLYTTILKCGDFSERILDRVGASWGSNFFLSFS